MQSTYQLKLSSAQQERVRLKAGITSELVEEVISLNGDPIGYMLQAYYSREKVSKVKLIPGSIHFDEQGVITLKLEYVMEEYNACSAINTEQKDKMTVTINADQEAGSLSLKGENWPEL